MVLDSALLNTPHYEVRIKGKVEQSRDGSSALPYLTTVANFTYMYKSGFGIKWPTMVDMP